MLLSCLANRSIKLWTCTKSQIRQNYKNLNFARIYVRIFAKKSPGFLLKNRPDFHKNEPGGRISNTAILSYVATPTCSRTHNDCAAICHCTTWPAILARLIITTKSVYQMQCSLQTGKYACIRQKLHTLLRAEKRKSKWISLLSTDKVWHTGWFF